MVDLVAGQRVILLGERARAVAEYPVSVSLEGRQQAKKTLVAVAVVVQ